jgi:predicted HAD superfamily phosphohydrolase YqeG
MRTPDTIAPVGYGLELPAWAGGWVPDFTADTVAGIDFGEVREQMGLKPDEPLHGIFDLDRTLRGMRHDKLADGVAENLGAQVADGRLTSVAIATNSRHNVDHFGPQLGEGVHTFTRADTGFAKPSVQFFEHIADVRGIRKDGIVMVGDMCLRDVAFAHRARLAGMNVVSVLVKPLVGPEHGGDYAVGRYLDRAALWVGSRVLGKMPRSA